MQEYTGQRCTSDRQNQYRPRSLLLQWHITERCNLRCAHCYQDCYSSNELPLETLCNILEQYRGMLNQWRAIQPENPILGHVTVTGGEPFIRSDFMDFLEVLHSHKREFGFAILTNGTFIDRTVARRLRRLRPSFVQVSVEGSRATHDAIRGPGNYDKTVAAIKHLVRARIRTLMSFTATRMNFREFESVARLGSSLRVARVWADRCIPCGTGKELSDELLTPEETRQFIDLMQRVRRELSRRWFQPTEVAMHRALQFLGGGAAYSCTAGDRLITLQPNGDLYPCRRMPLRVGNVLDTSLQELYHDSTFFRTLRDRNRVSRGCENCDHLRKCRGGLKCLSFSVAGDPFTADPGCWLAQHTLVDASETKCGGRAHIP
jgi:radical SAM protein with 4Fe4S-binding SPASM domain